MRIGRQRRSLERNSPEVWLPVPPRCRFPCATSRLPRAKLPTSSSAQVERRDDGVEATAVCKQADYPTHVGVTKPATAYAVTKSACGIAPLLIDGIGDTIRISLLGDRCRKIAARSTSCKRPRRCAQTRTDRLPDLRRLAIDLEKSSPSWKRPRRRHALQDQRAAASQRPVSTWAEHRMRRNGKVYLPQREIVRKRPEQMVERCGRGRFGGRRMRIVEEKRRPAGKFRW